MVDSQAQQAAFVLHTRPYRETSMLVDLFTLNEGRVPVVARGARRAGSQLRATLQPFSLLSVRYKGKEELKTLLSAEVVEFNPSLQGKALLCGLYANELLERLLLPLVPLPQMFLFYQYLLNELKAGDDLETALRVFEQKLLSELGEWLSFEQLTESYYRFAPTEGWVACEPSQVGAIPIDILHEINAGNFARPQVKPYAKLLMRSLLGELLGEKPLRSRALFEKRRKPDPLRSKNQDEP